MCVFSTVGGILSALSTIMGAGSSEGTINISVAIVAVTALYFGICFAIGKRCAGVNKRVIITFWNFIQFGIT